MVGIEELLCRRGLDITRKIKLVRHQDKRYDLDQLEREGLIELYQSYQGKPVFSKCDTIVSFIGLAHSHARFFGAYKVLGCLPAVQRPLADDFKYENFMNPNGVFYQLEEMPGFEDLKGRLVIDWGDSALAWHQWWSNKEVVELLPSGYVRDFPGYLDFILSFDELKRIIANPFANREWHRMLAAVAGVYLITDGRSGRQYVGSASGEGGILSRWTGYATTGHGGNKQLMQLLDVDSEHARDFSFTILRTLPKTLTRTEVVNFEVLYKQKLGSRAFGLNSN